MGAPETCWQVASTAPQHLPWPTHGRNKSRLASQSCFVPMMVALKDVLEPLKRLLVDHVRVQLHAIKLNVQEPRAMQVGRAFPHPCNVCMVIIWLYGTCASLRSCTTEWPSVRMLVRRASFERSSSAGTWPQYVRCQKRARQRKQSLPSSPSDKCSAE